MRKLFLAIVMLSGCAHKNSFRIPAGDENAPTISGACYRAFSNYRFVSRYDIDQCEKSGATIETIDSCKALMDGRWVSTGDLNSCFATRAESETLLACRYALREGSVSDYTTCLNSGAKTQDIRDCRNQAEAKRWSSIAEINECIVKRGTNKK